jgi:hypothetical protein
VNATAAELSAADRQALIDLIVEHAWLLDHGRWHDVAALYTEDGTLGMGANILQGREELRAWADHRAADTARQTHHQCTNIRVQAEVVGTATGTVMLVLHVSDGGSPAVEFVGEYRDHYVLGDDGQWRFRARALHPLGATDSHGGSDA